MDLQREDGRISFCLPLRQNIPRDAGAQSAVAHMAADADGQGVQTDLKLRKCLPQSSLPVFSRLPVPGIGGPDEKTLSLQTPAVLPQALDHGLHGGAHAPDLSEGIQLSVLDPQHRLDAEDAAKSRSCRRDPAAFFQQLQGVHRHKNIGIQVVFLQRFLDFPGIPALLCQKQGIQTPEEAKALGIGLIPMPVILDGECFFEYTSITPEEFFQCLKEGEAVSTSQPAPGDLIDAWENLLKTHEEVVYIPMSSGLSGSYQTAAMLAQDYDGRVTASVTGLQRFPHTEGKGRTVQGVDGPGERGHARSFQRGASSVCSQGRFPVLLPKGP